MPNHGRRRNLIVLESRRKSKKEIGPLIDQLKLEMIIGMRRELREMEESIGVALSKGAHVEPGIHTAQLIPQRRHGDFFMKLVILAIFLALVPAVCCRAGVFEDVNGDGKIDVSDLIETGSSVFTGPSEKRETRLSI